MRQADEVELYKRYNILKKRTAGCIKAAISDTSNFAMTFPVEANAEDRCLLLASIIFLDFRFFEEPPNNQSRGNRVGAI